MKTRGTEDNREYTVTFYTVDTVDTDCVDSEDPIGPEEVAAYAVERMMNHGGPGLVAVDVIESDGTKHRFDVELYDTHWICHPRQEDWWNAE